MVLLFFLIFCFCQVGGKRAALAAETASSRLKRIEKVFLNKKAKFGDKLPQKAFLDNKPLKIIVSLSALPTSKKKKGIQVASARATFRNKIRKAIDTTTDTLDDSKVKVVKKFSYSKGFAATVTLAGLEDLLARDSVQAVYEDRRLQVSTTQGLNLLEGEIPRSRYDGESVSIAILDTGIDYNHPMLGGGGFPNQKVIGGTDTGDDDADPYDAFGHGTACAGIAAGDLPTSGTGDYAGGVARGSKLYAVKISHADEYGSPTGYAWTSDIIEALEWCITHQYDDPEYPIMIVNISFGLGGYSSPCDTDTYAEVGVETIQNANLAGISMFASSGNDGYTQSLSLPACYSGIISVGAVYDDNIDTTSFASCSDETAADTVACYSNSSPDLDILAPSHNAYTTDTLGASGNTTDDYDPYFGGTSASSPYAAGSAAVIQSAAFSHRGTFFAPDEIRSILSSSGDSILDARNNIVKPRVNLNSALTSFLVEGDVNGDGIVDIADPINTLKIMSDSSSSPVSLYSDINSNDRVGIEEALYGLRYTAGMICMEGNLGACTTQIGCEASDGFWYSDVCHSTPSCDASDLSQCSTEKACSFVGGFWLMDQTTCIPDPTVEVESNNSTNTANKIYLNLPVTALLSESTDIDTFSLTTTVPQVARVSFSTTVTSTFWLLTVYNEEGTMISRHDVGNNDAFDVALPDAGTYYFQISVDSTHSGDPYTLQVSAINNYPLENIETEQNDTKATADSVTLGESIIGQLMSITDEDWYSLEADTMMDITITFSTAVASTYWLISVYDETDTLLVEDSVGNNGIITASLLSSGNYFIEVWSDAYHSDDQYSLMVESESTAYSSGSSNN